MAAAPMSGEYASAKAAAQRAYEQALANINARKGKTLQRYGYDTGGNVDASNPYGSLQLIRKQYDDAKSAMAQDRTSFAREMGINIDGENYSQSGADGVLQRLGQDHETVLQRLQDAKNKMQFQSGLRGRFDAQGNPLGLDIANDNEHSDFMKMLSGHASQMDQVDENAVGRGIGLKGLGAQQGKEVQFAQQGQRQDFRTSLIDMLTGNARNAQDENTDFTRRSADVDRSIRDALKEMMKSGKDLDFNKGKAEYDMGQALADALAGLDQESYGAQVDLGNSNMSAALNAALNGDPGTAPTPKAAPKKAAAPSQYFTYKNQVKLKPGQKLNFKAGSGYYAE